jgi:hypothetical protein
MVLPRVVMVLRLNRAQSVMVSASHVEWIQERKVKSRKIKVGDEW